MATDFSGLGGAAQGIFNGIGGFEQAAGLQEGARLARKNAAIEKLSTGIQLEQKTRQGYQILGATEAAAGANGISLTGSAMDVMRANAQQISLEKNLTEQQGMIEQNSWLEKASADEGAAQAAQMQAIGSIIGGIAGLF